MKTHGLYGENNPRTVTLPASISVHSHPHRRMKITRRRKEEKLIHGEIGDGHAIGGAALFTARESLL